MKAWRRSGGGGMVASCGVVPSDLVFVNSAGNGDLTFVAIDDAPSWAVQLFECGNPANVIISTSIPGGDRVWVILGIPPGNWQTRIRDSISPESCWVTSGCAVFP